MVYDCDEREQEVDYVFPAELVTPEVVCEMREVAGGLICVAIRHDIARKLGLPFMTDLLKIASRHYSILAGVACSQMPYGDKPAFSITVNHRLTFTGITDRDRALTISELARIARKALNSEEGAVQEEFKSNFRSPGHVHILIARPGLVNERQGHVELAVALAEIAGLVPAMVLCEMLDGTTGKALRPDDAKAFARSRGYAYVEGKLIVEAYSRLRFS